MSRILALDPDRVLDESKAGAQGAASLKEAFDEAQATYAKMREQAKQSPGPAQKTLIAELEAYETASLQKIEAQRRTLQQQLLAQARVVIDEVRKERGADVVLDARVVLACPAEDDITDAVIARLDQG